MNFVQFAKIFFKFLFGIFYNIDVQGYENIPESGDGYVLCANHSCWFDPLLIGSYYPDVLHFMAKKELFESHILSFLVRKLNAFPVDRNGSDLKAIKTAVKILREGKILGIFPEGTRNLSGTPGAKAGVAIIAINAKKNVLPVAITAEKNYRIFTRISIVIGKKISLEEYYSTKKIPKEKYQSISDDIMKNIYILKESNFSANSK
ncbi:MAG: 1-acyl-sn-glycerol-3-phosphate acyltransferase [Peptostreptococcaceae bacterium]|nr:1-acyl-sn-glycerol-3-phosphate acyltransferase [Peptostreptococcaceae bacterium]